MQSLSHSSSTLKVCQVNNPYERTKIGITTEVFFMPVELVPDFEYFDIEKALKNLPI